MTIFSTPRLQREDMGVHEFGASLGESLGAEAREAVHEMPVSQLSDIQELQTAKGERDDLAGMIERLQAGEDLGDVVTKPKPIPQVPTADARARVKEAGLDKVLTLPDGESIAAPALDIMMERARGRQERAATIARGPGGFIPGALSVGTSFLVGAVDPINIASAFIPVVGELRFAKMMEAAGESALSRAAVRARIGAASGAVGQVAIEPIAAVAKTQEGQDYTMAHALRSVIFGAALGGILHTGGGAAVDVLRTRQGRPLYPYDIGEPLEFHTPFDELRMPPAGAPAAAIRETFEEAARIVDVERAAITLRTLAPQEEAEGRAPESIAASTVTVNGQTFTGPNHIEALDNAARALSVPFNTPAEINAFAGRAQDGFLTSSGRVVNREEAFAIAAAADQVAERPPGRADSSDLLAQDLKAAAPTPTVAMIDDLPPRAREDTMRAAVAAITQGEPVRAGEMIEAAARHDPRIAESVANGNAQGVANAAQFTPAGRAVFDDMRTQLAATGMTPDEAAANAAIVAARYEARAARLEGAGGTAEDLYRAEGIQVRRGAMEDELGRMYAQRRQRPARGLEGQMDLPGTGPITDAELAQRRADEPLRPRVEQKPMEEGLFGTGKDQRELFQPATRLQAEPFYSAVARAVGAAKQERASPEQWLATIRNTPGVKAEELKWLGIEDWLKEQSGPVSRADVEAFVRANQIEIKEVEKGERPVALLSYVTRDELIVQLQEHDYLVIAEDGRSMNVGKGTVGSEDEARDYAVRYLNGRVSEINQRRLAARAETDTRYGKYTIPGGENYRELLLTLPAKPVDVNIPRPEPITELPEGYRIIHYGGNPPSREWGVIPPGQIHAGAMYGTEAASEAEAAQKAIEQINLNRRYQYDEQVREATREAEQAQNFKSAHWDEPNILAHVRLNDRTIDGKRTLFVEEVQSDWHQAGKRKGYNTKEAAQQRAELGKRLTSLSEEENRIRAEMQQANEDWGKAVPGAKERAVTLGERLQSVLDEKVDVGNRIAQMPVGEGVPDAPFKTTWPELAFKRVLRYAAENGYDKVAWTPGEVQAARYDLSKQIDELRVFPHPDGTYDLSARTKDAGRLHDIASRVREDKLPDYVGKEMAERIARGEGTPDQSAGKWRYFTGLDLKVGGEGMRGFYDKILPATVNKLVKRFGAKVEEGRLSERDVSIDNRSLAHATALGIEPVHTINITPELRKAALEEGFPLFQREPGGEMRGRITLADNRAIIDLFSRSDRSTFMHETGHLWLDELARDAARPNAPEGIRKDMDTVLRWLGAERPDAITDEQHEKWARAFEQYLADGKAPTEGLRAVFEQFRQWLAAIYRGLVGAGEAIGDDIRAVMDRMIATPEQLGERAAEAPSPVAVMQPRAARGPRARPEESWSLFEFLASRGGIDPNDPLAGDVRHLIGRNNKFVPGFGNLIRKGGMRLDEARRASVEAGYLFDVGEVSGREAQTTVSTLLDAMDREIRGEKVYRAGHEPRAKEQSAAEYRAEIEREIDGALREVEIDPANIPDKTMARVVQIMEREGEGDALKAYERAVMEIDLGGTEAGEVERVADHLPGWDLPDVASPAPAPGGTVARLGEPPRGRDGGPARGAGLGDRAANEPGDAWRRLADTPRDFNEPDVVAASKAAEALPEPASVEPSKRLQAAQKAEAEAQAAYDAAAEYLPPDLRERIDGQLKALDQEAADTAEVVRRGAACLAAGVVGGAV